MIIVLFSFAFYFTHGLSGVVNEAVMIVGGDHDHLQLTVLHAAISANRLLYTELNLICKYSCFMLHQI